MNTFHLETGLFMFQIGAFSYACHFVQSHISSNCVKVRIIKKEK